MFERFTDRARRVTVLSQEEARACGHAYIGTEHLLLAMISEGESLAWRVLNACGFHHDETCDAVLLVVPSTGPVPSGHIPFTPRAKKVFELGLREALQLGHNYIAPQHLLLGLIREGEGVAVQVLVGGGVDLGILRRAVIEAIRDSEAPPRPAEPAPQTRHYQTVVVACPDCGCVVADMAAHNEWHAAPPARGWR